MTRLNKIAHWAENTIQKFINWSHSNILKIQFGAQTSWDGKACHIIEDWTFTQIDGIHFVIQCKLQSDCIILGHLSFVSDWWKHAWFEIILLESIQGICKRPTYPFEDTIVWERWHFWRSEITVWYSASEVFVHLPCPSSNLVHRSLESTLIHVFSYNPNTFCLASFEIDSLKNGGSLQNQTQDPSPTHTKPHLWLYPCSHIGLYNVVDFIFRLGTHSAFTTVLYCEIQWW